MFSTGDATPRSCRPVLALYSKLSKALWGQKSHIHTFMRTHAILTLPARVVRVQPRANPSVPYIYTINLSILDFTKMRS